MNNKNFTSPTLLDIVTKTRHILRSSVVTDNSLIIKEIQQFMDFELPNTLDLKTFRSTWQFQLNALQPAYTFDTKRYSNIGKTILINSIPTRVAEDEDVFFSNFGNYNTFSNTTSFIGNGGSEYRFALPKNLVKGYVSPDGQVTSRIFLNADTGNDFWIALQDNGSGLVDAKDKTQVLGTINYQSGAVFVRFLQPIPSGNTISIVYNTCQPGQPFSCVFKNSVLEFRAVPDKPYVCEVEAYLKPSVLIAEDTKLAYSWLYDYISFGAAIRVYEMQGNTETVERLMFPFKKYEDMVMERSTRQESKLNPFVNRYTDSVYGSSYNRGFYGLRS